MDRHPNSGSRRQNMCCSPRAIMGLAWSNTRRRGMRRYIRNDTRWDCIECAFNLLRLRHSQPQHEANKVPTPKKQIPISKVKKSAEKVGKKYVCTSCNKGFGSFQALGGHRHLLKGKKGNSCCRADVALSLEGELDDAGASSSRAARDFDLNEVPTVSSFDEVIEVLSSEDEN